MTMPFPPPPGGWVCFHCGEKCMTCAEAAIHFGARPNTDAACLIKRGDERMLVLRLRKTEQARDLLFVRLEARRHGLDKKGEDEAAARYLAGGCFDFGKSKTDETRHSPAETVSHKELGQRSKAELEALFGDMYGGWERGVVITQERYGDGETRFSTRLMTPLELAARYVAAEIGANICEIANRAAFAPIITFSQIQVHLGPVFEQMTAEIERLTAERDRTARNRDMWKGQCERQAEQLTAYQRPESDL